MINPNHKYSIQYAMAVLLICSSIAIAFYQVIHLDDVVTGVRWYIAQAFLLAGSIFGLSYYVKTFRDEEKDIRELLNEGGDKASRHSK